MKIFCLVILLFLNHIYAACGFERWINRSKEPALKASVLCEVSYGTVQRINSTNFVVYYVTDGPHKTTKAFADSLSAALEDAYKLHSQTLKMGKMVAPARSYYFAQTGFGNKYPVEILDLDLMYYRETGEGCGQCFGLTIPGSGNSWRASYMAIDNDFKTGATCQSQVSTEPIIANGLDYSKNWSVALRATAIHELYHTLQIAQLNLEKHTNNWKNKPSFWLEASASGVEEIGYKEGGVYIGNLSWKFRNPQVSIEDTRGESSYGNATLYLYLYSVLGEKFDSAIWSLFSRIPTGTFSEHLVRLADSLKIDAEDLFHDYAKAAFFSGSRATLSPTEWFSVNQRSWPNWAVHPEKNAGKVLAEGAFDFVATNTMVAPAIDSVTRITEIAYEQQYGNIWAVSRLLDKEVQMPVPVRKFAAYPNPWRPNKNTVRFGPLPDKATGVEIRAANGVLIEQIKGSAGETLDWTPRKTPAPGVLYYRTLPHGKTGVLLVEH